mgnify:CR=1 FL=1
MGCYALLKSKCTRHPDIREQVQVFFRVGNEILLIVIKNAFNQFLTELTVNVFDSLDIEKGEEKGNNRVLISVPGVRSLCQI